MQQKHLPFFWQIIACLSPLSLHCVLNFDEWIPSTEFLCLVHNEPMIDYSFFPDKNSIFNVNFRDRSSNTLAVSMSRPKEQTPPQDFAKSRDDGDLNML